MTNQPPVVNIVNEAPADDPAPPTLDEMKQAIKDNHERLVHQLGAARAERDRANARVKALVEQIKEAERLVKALEPRKAKKS